MGSRREIVDSGEDISVRTAERDATPLPGRCDDDEVSGEEEDGIHYRPSCAVTSVK
jgi:hypothetical protein